MNTGEKKTEQLQGNPVAAPKLQMIAGEGSEAGSMEKIRDILFGNQLRDYERRFVSLKEDINKELSALREENKNRIEAIEVFFKKEIGTLKDRLRSEVLDRNESEKKLLQEIKDVTVSQNKKVAQVEEQLTEHATALQEQILEQSKKLSANILEKYHQTSRDLNDSVQALNDSKVERSALAESLVQVAMHLSGEPKDDAPVETSQG